MKSCTANRAVRFNKLAVQDDLDEALLENLFDRSSYLFEEPENLLKQELREPAVYNSVITAIAEGASRLNEIATKVGIESGLCSKYVRTLMELGIVRKETPMLEKEGKKRSIYWKISSSDSGIVLCRKISRQSFPDGLNGHMKKA